MECRLACGVVSAPGRVQVHATYMNGDCRALRSPYISNVHTGKLRAGSVVVIDVSDGEHVYGLPLLLSYRIVNLFDGRWAPRVGNDIMFAVDTIVRLISSGDYAFGDKCFYHKNWVDSSTLHREMCLLTACEPADGEKLRALDYVQMPQHVANGVLTLTHTLMHEASTPCFSPVSIKTV